MLTPERHLDTIADVELLHDVRHVVLDRPFTAVEGPGDLLV
jgi:hypothetical protein